MNTNFFLLLAERNAFSRFNDSFRKHSTATSDDVLFGLLIVATVIAGLWAVSRLWAMRRERRGYDGPRRLFWSLCKAHRIGWSDRWLLWRLARSQDLADPARMFLEAERLEASRLGPRLAGHAARVAALRKRLFGE